MVISNKNISTILIHIISWTILFYIPTLLKPEFNENLKHLLATHEKQFFYDSLIFKFLWILLFYLNAWVFIPKLFYSKSYIKYILSFLLSATVIVFTDYFLFTTFISSEGFKITNSIFYHLYPIIFILVASFAYRLIIDRLEASRIEKDKLNENLKTELSLLRSQVSPHFMFNVLNSMVALARKKSDLLEPSLIKLSQLLRYMLYETEHKVFLSKEIEYLKSYIDLQEQRFKGTVTVIQNIQVQDEELQIEPMLLIPFVENAFKHGIVMIENPEINISLVENNNVIDLKVENSFIENTNETKDKTKGIGLENVRRRLKLLYPAKHKLQIISDAGKYIVHLSIQL